MELFKHEASLLFVEPIRQEAFSEAVASELAWFGVQPAADIRKREMVLVHKHIEMCISPGYFVTAYSKKSFRDFKL